MINIFKRISAWLRRGWFVLDYEFVAGLAYSLNARQLDQVTVQDVISTIDLLGIDYSQRKIRNWFHQWEKTEDARVKHLVFEMFISQRQHFTESAAETEIFLRKWVDTVCGCRNYLHDHCETYERIIVADPKTELRVMRWLMRIRPLLTQLILRDWYMQYRGESDSVMQMSEAYRPEKYPLN